MENNTHEHDDKWLENPFGKVWELPPIDYNDVFFDFNYGRLLSPLQIQLDEFEDFADTFSFPSVKNEIIDYKVFVEKPQIKIHTATSFCDHSSITSLNYGEDRKTMKRKQSVELGFEDIQRYFDMPITKAAKEMKIGLTLLKKRCRELNIMRWPHRKIKSLDSLILNVKELGLENEVVNVLEENRSLLKKVPEMELCDITKKLRQACFKAKHNINKKKKKKKISTVI